MIDRLAHALEHVEELPPEAQEELAEQIEDQIEAFRRMPALLAPGQPPAHRSFAGIWRELPDHMEETLVLWRREATPTPRAGATAWA